MNYFKDHAAYSEKMKKQDKEIIKKIFPRTVEIIETSRGGEEDMVGVDYIAVDHAGKQIKIDVKRRQKGCSKYWKNGVPEIQLEVWAEIKKKIGWTIDDAKETDFVIFIYDKSDYTGETVLMPFDLLKEITKRNLRKWAKQKGCYKKQENKGLYGYFEATCLFMPLPILRAEIDALLYGCVA